MRKFMVVLFEKGWWYQPFGIVHLCWPFKWAIYVGPVEIRFYAREQEQGAQGGKA